MPELTYKNVDQKGRVVIGKQFANRTVIIQEIDDTKITVMLAKVVPEREAWLYENSQAEASVAKGLQQAATGQFSDMPPDLDSDAALIAELKDD